MPESSLFRASLADVKSNFKEGASTHLTTVTCGDTNHNYWNWVLDFYYMGFVCERLKGLSRVLSSMESYKSPHLNTGSSWEVLSVLTLATAAQHYKLVVLPFCFVPLPYSFFIVKVALCVHHVSFLISENGQLWRQSNPTMGCLAFGRRRRRRRS